MKDLIWMNRDKVGGIGVCVLSGGVCVCVCMLFAKPCRLDYITQAG